MSLSTSLFLLVLPQEILDKIVGYLASSPTSLVSCALTCTVLLPLSREHLYRDIHPAHNNSSVHLCLRTLKTSPFLASRIRTLRSGIHQAFEVAPFLPELRKIAFGAYLDRHAPRKWSKLTQEEAVSGLLEKSLGRAQESCVALTVPPSDVVSSLDISSASHLNLDFSTVGVWNLDSSRLQPSPGQERPTPRSLFVSGMPSVRDTSLVGETLTDPSFIADLTKLKAMGWVKPQAASFETVLQSSLMSSLEIIRIDIVEAATYRTPSELSASLPTKPLKEFRLSFPESGCNLENYLLPIGIPGWIYHFLSSSKMRVDTLRVFVSKEFREDSRHLEWKWDKWLAGIIGTNQSARAFSVGKIELVLEEWKMEGVRGTIGKGETEGAELLKKSGLFQVTIVPFNEWRSLMDEDFWF